MTRSLPSALTVFALLAGPALAEGTREMAAHEHGVGKLNIAIDGGKVALELHAPGADIVGFEHPATSDEDKAAIQKALALLANPLDLFTPTAAAKCIVYMTDAELESSAHQDHDDHEGDRKEHDDHDHDGDHKDHDHQGHDDHDDHDVHANQTEAQHTEFKAEYELTCAAPDAIVGMEFGYFAAFPNAQELEIQVLTSNGAAAYEITGKDPKIDLKDQL